MFGLFKKNPVDQLKKEYEKLMKEAMELQRSGDIKGFARKSEEAEEVMKKIVALNQPS
jgi:hypothetical protein